MSSFPSNLILALCFSSWLMAANDPQLIQFQDSSQQVRVWQENNLQGQPVDYYQIAYTDGTFGEPVQAKYTLHLRGVNQDPTKAAAYSGPDVLMADDASQEIFVVQFVTQSIQAYRTGLQALNVEILGSVPNYAHVVRMQPNQRAAVEALPYVRWVGPLHPGYRLEGKLTETLEQQQALPSQRYHVLLFEYRDIEAARTRLLAKAGQLNIAIDRARAGKRLLIMTMNQAQLVQVSAMPEVAFINIWSPYEQDMDKVRELGGANFLENTTGFTGQGIRGEVFDTGFNLGHVDFQSRPLIEHGSMASDSHGAATSGIVFGDGTGSADARGLLPDGQGIVRVANDLSGPNRYDMTQDLLSAPYFAMFQTSSVGSVRTTDYTSLSAEQDSMLFDIDIVHFQSQSNAGNRDSRPQAWAKNVISGGAVNHYDTLDISDDCWCNGGSIGPASDGRIKPDLNFFYDETRTVTTGSDTAYTNTFGGTSGATPSIAGYGGLFIQMWVEGYFGNEINGSATPFENRPRAMLTKAALIASARQYSFSGADDDMTRVHQGWGMPDLENLQQKADRTFFVNETDLLTPGATQSYFILVNQGEPELKVSMAFLDPAALPSASIQRINNLDLKVTSPSGTVYWGNNGLLLNNYSTPDGDPNSIDTVENVFVEAPENGAWLVEVIGTEIIEDNHVETPALDADFALAVVGGSGVEDFVIDLPENQSLLCGTTTSQMQVDISPIGDFAGAVNLSATNLPTGLSVSFSQDQVTPPAQVTVTLENTGAVPTGAYTITLTAQAGDVALSLPLKGYISYDAPSAPNLASDRTLPTVADTTPLLTWTSITGAYEYDIQIASDRDFNNIVESQTVSDSRLQLRAALNESSLYFWRVLARNSCSDGAYATAMFVTPKLPKHPVQAFIDDFDLDGHQLTFTPSDSGEYVVCGDLVQDLPFDHNLGTPLSMSDDGSSSVPLSQSFTFYGQAYDTVFVNANGNLTFDVSDSNYQETLAAHFDRPRVAALFDDLTPGDTGITWQEVDGNLVVSYNLPQYNTSDSNVFQIVLHYASAAITIAYGNVDANDAVVGLSPGERPDDITAVDLSDPPCEESGCLMDLNGDGQINLQDRNTAINLWLFETSFGDVTENGRIDILDIISIEESQGVCPE